MDGTVSEGVLTWEQASAQWLVAILGWIMHALHHVGLLGRVAEETSSVLILVDECEFTASLIE